MSNFKPSNRAPWQDYRSRCYYMITITKCSGTPRLSTVLPAPMPHFETTKAGELLLQAFYDVIDAHNSMQIIEFAIMPDHAHFIIFVKERIPKALGSYIGQAKGRATAAIRHLINNEEAEIFEPDFTDSIVYSKGRLQTLIDYVRDNPRRLIIKRKNRNHFKIISGLTLLGREFEACGNILLLDLPDLEPIIIHRADSEETKREKHYKWRHCVHNRGAFISPFISKEEKAVMEYGIEQGANVILLTNEPIGERFKPQGKWFDLCAEGRLLVLHPKDMEGGSITRKKALALNGLAEQICKAKQTE